MNFRNDYMYLVPNEELRFVDLHVLDLVTIVVESRLYCVPLWNFYYRIKSLERFLLEGLLRS